MSQNGKITLGVPGVGNGTVEISKDLLVIEKRTRTEHTREYTPNVIEPSFGIGRILYSLLEHSYWTRAAEGSDESRGVLSFPPPVAPTKVLLVPLSGHESFKPLVKHLSHKLRTLGISSRVDDSSASIGRRYSRNDELGTPLGITVDFQSVQDKTFTLRDRDSTKQVRADEETIVRAIQELVNGEKEWKDVQKELPAFEGQDAEAAIPIR